MSKTNPANERIKYAYFRYLAEARGRDEATIDGVAKSLARFEASTGARDYKRFHREQVVAFKAKLAAALSVRTGRRLSKTTMLATMRHLREFFFWLAHQPGFRSHIAYEDADYFNLSAKDVAVGRAKREKRVPALLFALFWVQSRGTERVAAYFGPITLVWFIVLAALGLLHAFDRPVIFRAIDPSMAVRFFVEHGFGSLWVMGSVFLAVTGAEALYADMGHFGRGPIRLAWSAVVFPALALNYFGQGSLMLAHPEAASNSFFLLAPEWALLPLVLMATVATVIASQAVITGAYSLTQQAVQLGLLPRFAIRHTSESLVGQIYMPRVNWLLLAAVMTLVLLFGSSAALASAYGIAVTGAMLVDSLLAFTVFRLVWRWPLALTLAVLVPLAAIEVSFFGANLLKFFHGGYVPVFLALALALAMATWVRGASFVYKKAHASSTAVPTLIEMLEKSKSVMRARDRGLPDLRSGECPLGASAQSQTQPCATRAEHPAQRFDCYNAPSSRGRSAVDRVSIRRFYPDVRWLRLHGRAERAGRARTGAKARGEVRHHGDDLLSEPAQLPRVPRYRNAALAGPPFHHVEQIRYRRGKPLSSPFQPRRRAR